MPVRDLKKPSDCWGAFAGAVAGATAAAGVAVVTAGATAFEREEAENGAECADFVGGVSAKAGTATATARR